MFIKVWDNKYNFLNKNKSMFLITLYSTIWDTDYCNNNLMNLNFLDRSNEYTPLTKKNSLGHQTSTTYRNSGATIVISAPQASPDDEEHEENYTNNDGEDF